MSGRRPSGRGSTSTGCSSEAASGRRATARAGGPSTVAGLLDRHVAVDVRVEVVPGRTPALPPRSLVGPSGEPHLHRLRARAGPDRTLRGGPKLVPSSRHLRCRRAGVEVGVARAAAADPVVVRTVVDVAYHERLHLRDGPAAEAEPEGEAARAASETRSRTRSASTRPAPITRRRDGRAEQVVLQLLGRLVHHRGLDLLRRPVRVELRSSVATPATCGVAIEVPENFGPVAGAGVRRLDVEAGRGDVRLEVVGEPRRALGA